MASRKPVKNAHAIRDPIYATAKPLKYAAPPILPPLKKNDDVWILDKTSCKDKNSTVWSEAKVLNIEKNLIQILPKHKLTKKGPHDIITNIRNPHIKVRNPSTEPFVKGDLVVERNNYPAMVYTLQGREKSTLIYNDNTKIEHRNDEFGHLQGFGVRDPAYALELNFQPPKSEIIPNILPENSFYPNLQHSAIYKE